MDVHKVAPQSKEKKTGPWWVKWPCAPCVGGECAPVLWAIASSLQGFQHGARLVAVSRRWMIPYPAHSDKESTSSTWSPDALVGFTLFTPVYDADVEMTPRSHAQLDKTLNNHNLAIEPKWCDSRIIGFENGDNTNSKTAPPWPAMFIHTGKSVFHMHALLRMGVRLQVCS